MVEVKIEKTIEVEVVYARPERQQIVTLNVVPGTTVAQAIRRSGVLVEFPEIDLQQVKVGIFSKFVQLDDILQAGDRVEIYRPLLIDPKERRRKRATINRIRHSRTS